MARMRTIQANFPLSTSMGRIGRDARLLFILLWTVADDAGRLRAAPAGLAGRLFPTDTDAPIFLTSWLDELEREGCIERYTVENVDYLRVVQWRKYQKIDHPSQCRLPPSAEETRLLASRKSREASRRARESDAKALEENDLSEPSPESREAAIFAAREVTGDIMMSGLQQIGGAAASKGSFHAALRAMDMMGRRIGFWRGDDASGKDAAPGVAFPHIDELVPPSPPHAGPHPDKSAGR